MSALRDDTGYPEYPPHLPQNIHAGEDELNGENWGQGLEFFEVRDPCSDASNVFSPH